MYPQIVKVCALPIGIPPTDTETASRYPVFLA